MNPLLLNTPLTNPFMRLPPPDPPQMVTGGTLEGVYGAFWMQFEGTFREASAQLQAVGLEWMADLLTPILIIVTMTWGLLLASGQMNGSSAMKYGGRVIFMLWLIVGGGWTGTVNKMVLEDFPNELAQRIHGAAYDMRAVDQFDTVDQVIKGIAATALGQATNPVYVGERIIIHAGTKFASAMNGLMFYVWCAERMLLYMVVTMGAFLLIFIPFDGTAQFMRQNFGKMVGLSAWQLASAIMVKVMLTGTMLRLDQLSNGTVQSLGNMIDVIGDVGSWCLGCLVLFLLLPAVAGYGSAVVASQTAVQGMIFGGVAMAAGGIRSATMGLASATNRTISRYQSNIARP